jgi:hypothetical protein
MSFKNILFTTNYGTDYDGWEKITSENRVGGFYDTYQRGDYTINVTSSVFYLFLEIKKDDKVVAREYVKTIPEYKKLKKKLGWT